MFRLPNAIVYEAAELGLNAVVVGTGGAIVQSTTIVPWAVMGPFQAVSYVVESAVGSLGTPFDLFHRPAGFDGAIPASVGNAGTWTGITNNPRRQYGGVSLVRGGATLGSTGTGSAAENPKVFSAPYMNFAFRNNDGVNTATLTLLNVYLHF